MNENVFQKNLEEIMKKSAPLSLKDQNNSRKKTEEELSTKGIILN
jgi:hypothetical protein